ncbi:MAG: MBL fold metallo-hydrolase [Acidobacteriota bacterium]
MSAKLGFHGAARTVTGSRYLLTLGPEGKEQRIGIDAGLFQGYKKLRELNWRDPPYEPWTVDQILLTHTHIDHAGFLPRLVKRGFKGPIYCTRSTLELALLLLPDSAKIQEEHARYANKKKYSRHAPALPLYSVDDAKETLKQFETVSFNEWLNLGRARARFHGAGHILGSASIEIEFESKGANRTLLMSGDIGRYDMPLHLDPEPREPSDLLVCESTYGNRDHDFERTIDEQLAEPVGRALRRGGTVLIPAFAVGRSQQITLILRRLMASGEIPEVPVYIDSPMAVDATKVYSRHLDEHHLDADVFEDGRTLLFPERVELCKSVQQSKAINNAKGPKIIVSASGMLTAGRVLHHLKRLAPDPKNLVILAGYQAPGTRGRDMLQGSPTVRVHGQDVRVRAESMSVHGLSAHAGRSELLRWMEEAEGKPTHTFLTHGEADSAFALAQDIRRKLGWDVSVPELDETVDLDQFFSA